MLRQLFTLLALMTGLAVSGDIASVQPAQAAEVAFTAQAEAAAIEATSAERLADEPRVPVDCDRSRVGASQAVPGLAPAIRIRVDRALE